MQTGTNEPFVTRFEQAVMQYVILDKAKQGEVTRDNLKQVFRGNLQMSKDHFDTCVQTLVSDGHIKESGNKFTITEDGREDIQKLQNIVVELPNIVSGSKMGGQQQRSGMQQPVGSQSGSTGSTGTSGSSSTGGQPRNR